MILPVFHARPFISYISNKEQWHNRLFLNLLTKKDKTFITIDRRTNILNGPVKPRTNAENEKKQLCYFNKKTKDKTYNTFVSKRIPYEDKILFLIESVLGMT